MRRCSGSRSIELFVGLTCWIAAGAGAQAPAAAPPAAPGWIRDGALTRAGAVMLGALRAAGSDGLDPAAYHAARLDSLAHALAGHRLEAADMQALERSLTSAALGFLHDVRLGRAAPPSAGRMSPRPNAPSVPPWVPATALADAIRGDSVAQLIRAARPPFTQYRRLAAALARYRQIDTLKPPVLPRTPLRPGDRLDSAPELGAFLAQLADLPVSAVPPAESLYTGPLADGVRHFQTRHALEPDGVIGATTAAALRVPIEQRIRQIQLAMERLRWLPRVEGERFIVVNVPAFQLFAFDSSAGNGSPALEMRVIVGGAEGKRTPMLFERLRGVEFQPYWNVPPSILRKEILPKLRRSPGYLRANDMEIVTESGTVLGDAPTPGLMQALAAGTARVRQRPGEQNALGAVKLVFPNPYNVYIHGTPAQSLFAERRRDFSHGCIRAEDPPALAIWVLQDEPGWGCDEVNRAMAGTRTFEVPVSSRLPVLVFYTTAIVRADGTVRFYPDVYRRD